MQILHLEAIMSHSLKPWNTFGIDRSASAIVRAETEKQLLDTWQNAAAQRPIRLASGRFSLNRRQQKNPMLSHEVFLFI